MIYSKLEYIMKIENDKLVFEDNDLYNLDYTLGEIIVEGLTKFKEDLNSIPSSFLPSNRNPTEEEENLAFIEWSNAIDKMILSFSDVDTHEMAKEILIKNGCEYPVDTNKTHVVTDENDPNYRQLVTVYKEGFTKKDFVNFSKKQANIKDKLDKERVTGRILFATHFESLWK